MSFLPRQRPAPLVDDDEDGAGGNGDGSVQLDSLALLLATAYLLAYLTLHTLTGWASIATVVPLTAALLYHYYHDDIPRSTAECIESEQAQLSALVKSAVVYCSGRKKAGQRQQQQRARSPADALVDELEYEEQSMRRVDSVQSLGSPLHLQLTSPNAHSHPIELSDESTAERDDRAGAGEAPHLDEDEKGEEADRVLELSSAEQHLTTAASAVTAPRSATASTAAASLLSPKTPIAVLDAAEM